MTIIDEGLEHAWTLLGVVDRRVWIASFAGGQVGRPSTVEVNWHSIMMMEKEIGNVVGFYHTHPHWKAIPSQRDIDTMGAWCSSLGKPLLCAIHGTDGLRGWVFQDNPKAIEPTFHEVDFIQMLNDNLAILATDPVDWGEK